MKRILLCILFMSSLVYSGDYSTDLCAGIAMSSIRPGPFVSFGPNLRIGKYFSIGLHVDYSWTTIKTGIDGLREGYHIPDAAVIPKLHLPVIANGGFFAELDPGFGLGIYYRSYKSTSWHDVKTGFSMTFGGGFEIKKFVVGYKYKIQVYTPSRSVFYIGFLGD